MSFQLPARPIDRVVANDEIKKFIQISEPSRTLVNSILQLSPGSAADLSNFHSSKFNAFIFPRNEVLRFFFPGEVPAVENKADFLMVILGAHLETNNGFVGGTPTVIITGIKEVITEEGTANAQTVFLTTDPEKPATEYPPQTVVSELPPAANANILLFTVESN